MFDSDIEEVDSLPATQGGLIDVTLHGFAQSERGSSALTEYGHTGLIEDIVMYGGVMHILTEDIIYRVISWE